jgi:hypothetical protein
LIPLRLWLVEVTTPLNCGKSEVARRWGQGAGNPGILSLFPAWAGKGVAVAELASMPFVALLACLPS